MEELDSKYILGRASEIDEKMLKSTMPILIKLISDSNPRIAQKTFKIIESLMRVARPNFSEIIPQLFEKLMDNKMSLSQSIVNLAITNYTETKNKQWLDEFLAYLKRPIHSTVKEEIVNGLHKLYEENKINYNI